jgi:hypothetical protein
MSTAKDLALPPNTQGKGRAQVFAAYQQAIAVEPPEPVPPTPIPPPPTPPTEPTPTPPPPPGDGCGALLKNILGGR